MALETKRILGRVAVHLGVGLSVWACQPSDDADKRGSSSSADDTHSIDDTDSNDDTDSRDTQSDDALDFSRFEPHILPESMRGTGYIDSTFINKSGDRIYFLHSIFSPAVIAGAPPEDCSHLQAEQLPGHTTSPGFEWNTDLYYVQWDGSVWSEPINLGSTINTVGMECCVWLNADETEIIFNTLSDTNNDGVDGDNGVRSTGNYRATREHRDAEWRTPEALPGEYGTEGQTANWWRNDIEKTPSGNLYLWERTEDLEDFLVFGERTGGTYESPTYASPARISGTTTSETQIWVNDAETRLVFNHRHPSYETELYTRVRASVSDEWEAPTTVSTEGFADSNGLNIWGEPSFDKTQSFMLLTRFNTSEAGCWTSEILFSEGDVEGGFGTPNVLN